MANWTSLGIIAALVTTAAIGDEPTDAKSRVVLTQLKRKVGVDFPEETPVWDIVNYLSVASQTPPEEAFKFDFDDEGLRKAGMTRHSRVPAAIKGDDVLAEESLERALKPLGLIYEVKEGTLLIKVGFKPR